MKPVDLTADQVREALRVCFDPELPVNIVDLGLVYDIDIHLDLDAPGLVPRYVVRVTLTMRAPNDQREALLAAQVENRLMGLPEVSRAHVLWAWQPAWTADRMSAVARRQLQLGSPAQPRLVQIQL